MVNREPLGAGMPPVPAYFVLGAWHPAGLMPHELAASRATEHARRFFNDWQRLCLPLPLCSTPTEHAFDAYRFWCRLQDNAPPLPMNQFVTMASELGFNKGRHLITPLAGGTGRQYAVIHPPVGAAQIAGRELNEAAAAFSAAVTGWRQAVAQAQNGTAKA